MSDNKLVKNVKEAAALIGISAGIGYLALYARDYLVEQKIIPT